MSYAQYIKEIRGRDGGAHDFSEEDAYQLFGTMLDGGVPDLELGAILLAMHAKTESLSEFLGFYRATIERLNLLHCRLPTLSLLSFLPTTGHAIRLIYCH